MNFFQSVFSDDLPEVDSETPQSDHQNPHTIPTITSAWTFGSSLMKTLASKSESVIHTYRHDFQEFSSGIKKETAMIREAATRAVKDLPTSLEAGAGLAQESLESVGQAIDDLGTTVSEIIAQGKDSILALDDSDSETDVADANVNHKLSSTEDLRSSKPYSRLDAQIRTIQSDMNTYLKDPDDLAEYNEWKLGFKFDEMEGEIEDLINRNNVMVGEIHREIVPSMVDNNSFWSRYFFRVHKTKMAEEARAKLVKRAISGQEEEELSWDVDEDDYQENSKHSAENLEEQEPIQIESEVDKLESKSKTDSDISIISSQPSQEEEGWDEIEDVGKVVSHGSPSVINRLSITVGEEDLTWDIEEEDDDDQA